MPAPAAELLIDGFGRIKESVHQVLDGLPHEALVWRPDADANSAGWLLWHLTRVQDAQIAPLAGAPEVWTEDGWVERFALPYPASTHGYGASSADVGAFDASAELLAGYYDATHARTEAYLAGLDDDAYAEVVDAHWNPPVTAGVRIVSILDDDARHIGQAEYVRGQWERSAR
ncbi:hypothetical protein BIV57_17100 [Mangrovactinospora gilvigrisea]|uniref:DinB-like domain-containing protein n=1 Tax=Mangrovactinospora gilvigrisea TaxID=1428644 RepID=A0A1J7C9G9_9ACTN|nr:DinB family protein [Mangrovactinospora gilvigrisea]OIV36290.1 hypothetical protein BIV57_17100 [Mangrovactinospora gilvigrisea]